MIEKNEDNLNFDDMCTRYDCRANYRENGSFESPKTLTPVEQHAWDDEVKQIKCNEAEK